MISAIVGKKSVGVEPLWDDWCELEGTKRASCHLESLARMIPPSIAIRLQDAGLCRDRKYKTINVGFRCVSLQLLIKPGGCSL